jgi:hypothetical protein
MKTATIISAASHNRMKPFESTKGFWELRESPGVFEAVFIARYRQKAQDER